MTITEFLTARLDEESRFWANPSAMRFGGVGLSALILRMRADIAAKRAIVAEHGLNTDLRGARLCRVCVDWAESDVENLAELYPCRTLVLLTQPYAEHPDFDPAWRV